MSPAARAQFVHERLPAGGLFQDQHWRISPEPFTLSPQMVSEIESLGRVLLQFYRALNLLYRQSAEGKQPAWVADWLDQGKPAELIQWQRANAFKNDVPRVIRPDLLITDNGLSIMELDSVPGGIGLTAWLNQVYSELAIETKANGFPPRTADTNGKGLNGKHGNAVLNPEAEILGGAEGMLRGFSQIFGEAPRVHIIVSEEAATYMPEMRWVAERLGPRFQVQDARFNDFSPGDAVYRFFELFDLPNVPNARAIVEAAMDKRIRLTPPVKPVFEEKMMFALLWNRNLSGFWRRQLGEGFFQRLLEMVPYSWLMDPTPLPPHAAIPELNITDWRQLGALSQRQRDLILKISGFSPNAWGARGVYLGSDLSQGDWSAAVDQALASFGTSPYILQRYEKPRLEAASYYDFANSQVVPMPGRVRLCPYYFVQGENDAARAHLGGVLAT
ncbi:MAG TPA: hypothetical protein VNZ22_20815, partial [Bacillota bacterium]|nr:hypothetical protein [Bacillota bacterium]